MAPDSFRKLTGFRPGGAFALVVSYWLAIVLLDAVTDGFNIRYGGWQLTSAQLWLDRAVWFGLWIALTPLVLVAIAWAHPRRVGWARSLGLHLLAQAALVVVHALGAAALFALFAQGVEPMLDRAVRLTLTVGFGPRDLAVYWGLIGVFTALSLRERSRLDELRVAQLAAESAELSRLLTETKLESLRRELNPHLLFNALNSVSTFVRDGDRTRALEMIAAMSDLLRAYLKRSREDLVTLEEELNLLDTYLAVERVRLEDRLEVRISVEPGLTGAMVPPFLLQPIAENAIKHGFDRIEGRARLEITARATDDTLWITVEDSGQGIRLASDERVRREGVGLSNTRRRLAALFGEEAGLDLTLGAAGACATAWLPVRGTTTARAS